MTYRNNDHLCVKIEKDFSLDIGIELICEIDHTNKVKYAFFIDHLAPASAADRFQSFSNFQFIKYLITILIVNLIT